MKKLIQTTVDKEQADELKRVAQANGTSMADTARLAIKLGLRVLDIEISDRDARVLIARSQVA